MNEQEIAQRVALAQEYFTERRMNCAQSVAMAFSDLMGMDVSTVEALAAGFGAGFARQREVCGTISGATLALGGIMAHRGVQDVKSQASVRASLFCESCRSMNGSIICRELTAIRAKKSPKPQEISSEQWNLMQNRSCKDYVAYAARLLAQEIGTL